MIRIYAPIIYEDSKGSVREWDIPQRRYEDDHTAQVYSIERPWLDNAPNVSRIPNGIYSVIPWVSPSKGAVWALIGGGVSPHKEDVPDRADRWGVLIHVANYPHNVEGCLGLGDKYAEKTKTDRPCPAVWNSKHTIEKFREIVHGEAQFMLYLT